MRETVLGLDGALDYLVGLVRVEIVVLADPRDSFGAPSAEHEEVSAQVVPGGHEIARRRRPKREGVGFLVRV